MLAIQPCSLAAPPPHLLGDVGPSGAPPHLSVVVVAQYHAASGPRLGPPRNPSRAPWRKGSHPGPQARFQQHSIIYSCFVCVSASLWCPRSLPLSDTLAIPSCAHQNRHCRLPASLCPARLSRAYLASHGETLTSIRTGIRRGGRAGRHHKPVNIPSPPSFH